MGIARIASPNGLNHTDPMSSLRACGVVLCALLLVAGCTSDKRATQTGASTTIPAVSKACTTTTVAAVGASSTTISEGCADVAFAADLAGSSNKRFEKLSADQVVAFGRSLCAYGAALGASTTPRPLLSEVVRDTSKSWGVDPSVVEDVYEAAHALCPDALKSVDDLHRTPTGVIDIELTVGGSGNVSVSYSAPD